LELRDFLLALLQELLEVRDECGAVRVGRRDEVQSARGLGCGVGEEGAKTGNGLVLGVELGAAGTQDLLQPDSVGWVPQGRGGGEGGDGEQVRDKSDLRDRLRP